MENRIWIDNIEQVGAIVASLQANGLAYTVYVKTYSIYVDVTGY